MAHNSFDLNQIGHDAWEAKSHNFPEISATGATEEHAIGNLSRAIVYYRDNNKTEFLKRIRERIQRGWACACGEPFLPDDLVIGVWGA